MIYRLSILFYIGIFLVAGIKILKMELNNEPLQIEQILKINH